MSAILKSTSVRLGHVHPMYSRPKPKLDPSKWSLFNLFYQYSDRTNCVGNFNFPPVYVGTNQHAPSVSDISTYSKQMSDLTGIQSRIIEIVIAKELKEVEPYLPWLLKMGDYSRAVISVPFRPRAFCPRCFWEQKERGERPYPLLEHNLPWSVVCRSHMYPLADISGMQSMESKQLHNSTHLQRTTSLVGALPLTFKTAIKFTQLHDQPNITLFGADVDFLEAFYAICFIMEQPIIGGGHALGNCLFETDESIKIFSGRDFFDAEIYLHLDLERKARILNLVGHFLFEDTSFEFPQLTQQKKRERARHINTYGQDLREIETNNFVFLALMAKQFLGTYLEKKLERHFPNFYALVWRGIVSQLTESQPCVGCDPRIGSLRSKTSQK